MTQVKGSAIGRDIERIFATVAEAQAAYGVVVGSTIKIKERANGIFEAVLTSGVTPNGYNIIQSTANPAIQFELQVGQILRAKEVGLIEDGTDSDTDIQAWFDIGKSEGASILKPSRSSLFEGIQNILNLPSQMTLDGNLSTFRSLDLTNEDIIRVDSFSTIKNCIFEGGDEATAAVSRKVRAIHVVGAKENIRISDNFFYNFYITGIYSSGDRNNIPSNLRVYNNYFDGTDKQLQGITIFCGKNVYIEKNIIDNMDSLPILVDEATNATPMANYGKLDNVHITQNIINFNLPTNVSVLYGIQMTSCEVGSISNNTVNGLPSAGRGIVATIYDLGQQKARVEGFGESIYTPIDQRKSRVTISNNRITGGGIGVYCLGYTAPIISDNQIVSDLPLWIGDMAATISGTPYSYPSTTDDGLNPTNMNAQVKGNTIISTNVLTEAIYISSNRNYFLDNIFLGDYSQKYNAINSISTHVTRDANGSLEQSGTLIAGSRLSGVVIPAAAAGAANVSLVDGSGNVLERFLGYTPTDYHVIITGDWDGAGQAYVPDSAKSNSAFQVNFPAGFRPPTASNKLWWTIIHSEAYKP